MIYSLHSENYICFSKYNLLQSKIFLKQLLKLVRKTLVEFNNTNLDIKAKVENVHLQLRVIIQNS